MASGRVRPLIAQLPRSFLLFAMCDTVPKISRREETHDDFNSATCCPLRDSCLGWIVLCRLFLSPRTRSAAR